MNWIKRFQHILRHIFAGNMDERLQKVEIREIELSEEQRKQRGKLRQVSLALRRDKSIKCIQATAAIGTVLIGVATAIIGIKGCERAKQEIELVREKAFYRPGIILQEDGNQMVFVFMNPGERTFQDFRAVWEVVHIPSGGDVHREINQPLKQVWGMINGRETFRVALPIPSTNDNLYAMAVCSGISIFNRETRTNLVAAVRYRYGGQWNDYRGGTVLGEPDRGKVEDELHRLHEINRTQSAGKYSDNW